tara:strand:- start:14 stop:280 length:267 start_codon:yes stop_codon:yes gene_type:complete
MALEKTTREDKIELLAVQTWTNIQIRTATIIMDDGKEISRNFHRHVLDPNSDVSGQTDEIKKLAEIYFTEDAKAKHKAFVDSQAGGIL